MPVRKIDQQPFDVQLNWYRNNVRSLRLIQRHIHEGAVGLVEQGDRPVDVTARLLHDGLIKSAPLSRHPDRDLWNRHERAMIVWMRIVNRFTIWGLLILVTLEDWSAALERNIANTRAETQANTVAIKAQSIRDVSRIRAEGAAKIEAIRSSK